MLNADHAWQRIYNGYENKINLLDSLSLNFYIFRHPCPSSLFYRSGNKMAKMPQFSYLAISTQVVNISITAFTSRSLRHVRGQLFGILGQQGEQGRCL